MACRLQRNCFRAYHGAVSDWDTNRDVVWFDGSRGIGGHGRIVCHGDFHPCNIVWDGRDAGVASLEPPLSLPLPAACGSCRRTAPEADPPCRRLAMSPTLPLARLFIHERRPAGAVVALFHG